MQKAFYIVGPTASGKSSLANAMARNNKAAIVNVDAYQCYRSLPILTASPTIAEKQQARHLLYNQYDSDYEMNAASHRQQVLQTISQQDVVPLLVGGAGMYIKQITHGCSPLPAKDDTLRQQLAELSTSALVEKLAILDQTSLARIGKHNRRYLIRAVEICLLSKQPASILKTQWQQQQTQIDQQLTGIYLLWDAEALRQRIKQRVTSMFEQGVVDEVAALPKKLSVTIAKTIGVAFIQEYLAGRLSLEDCQEKIYFATCQYAKRQRTWFKKEHWLTTINITKEADLSSAFTQAQQLYHNI